MHGIQSNNESEDDRYFSTHHSCTVSRAIMNLKTTYTSAHISHAWTSNLKTTDTSAHISHAWTLNLKTTDTSAHLMHAWTWYPEQHWTGGYNAANIIVIAESCSLCYWSRLQPNMFVLPSSQQLMCMSLCRRLQRSRGSFNARGHAKVS